MPGQQPAQVEGQLTVATSPTPVRRVWLRPVSPGAPAEVIEAIATADQVVLGPGSLYTSVLAVCAVPEIRQALSAREGGRAYVCNLRPQQGETSGYDADAHIAALVAHGVVADTVLCDPASEVGVPSGAGDLLSALAGPEAGGAKVVAVPLSAQGGHSHDPALLAEVLEALL